MKRKCLYLSTLPDEAGRKVLLSRLARYPCLCVSSLGKSVLGRDIPLVRIGRGRRAILYVGAHHGMEWITCSLLLRLLSDLAIAHTRRGEGGKGPLPADTSLYVLPILNPDGVELALHGARAAGRLRAKLLLQSGGDFSRWQANARGVDLNHNYDAGFAAYRIYEHVAGIRHGCATRYSGPYPFSEPETEAMRRLLVKLRPALTLTLHTQGEEIFYRKTSPPVAGAEEIGTTLAALTGYRLSVPEGMAAYGGLADYIAEEYAAPAFTLECGLGRNPLPPGDAPHIYLRLRRALFLSLCLGAGDERRKV